MSKHEKHCTMNPNRKCRVCTLINGGDGNEVLDLVKMLPDASEFNNATIISEQLMTDMKVRVDAGMEKIREVTDNCPACIMAALRQAKIAVPMVDSFDFKEEMKRVFKEYNEDQQYYW
jgi:hypothetical protein